MWAMEEHCCIHYFSISIKYHGQAIYKRKCSDELTVLGDQSSCWYGEYMAVESVERQIYLQALPHDTPPRTKPHLPILPIQFHQTEMKHLNLQAYGGILIQTITTSYWLDPHGLLSLLYYNKTQDHQPRGVPTHNILSPPPSITCLQPSLMGAFSHSEFPPLKCLAIALSG